MSSLRVLIVGASIAGPTAAYWFAKAGASVTVIERFPDLRTNGQNIDIRTSGVTVMRRIPGMEAAVRAEKTEIDGLALIRDDGIPYGILKSSGNPDQQTLLSEYEIFRGKLSKILYDLTKDSQRVNYIFNEQIESIQQLDGDKGTVRVKFMQGTLPAEYDLVVACDGATSRTRAIGFDCGVRDHIHSTGVWAAYFSIKKDLLNGSKMGHGYGSISGKVMFMGQDPAIEGGNTVTMMIVHPQTDGKELASVREVMKQGDDALKKHLTDCYKNAGWRTNEVLVGLAESDNLYASEVVQVKVPSLYKDRVVLVGDAGYAPGLTGTGTSLALTGAYVLAGEVVKANGDVKVGLAGYEKTMRPLIDKMTNQPPFITTFMAPQTAWGLWLRNTTFGVITWFSSFQFTQWIFGSASGKASEFPLPEYKWVE